MSLLSRLQRSVKAFRTAPDFREAERRIDALIQANQADDAQQEKQLSTKSRLDVRKTDHDLTFYYGIYSHMRNLAKRKQYIPPYGDPDRDYYLAHVWQTEPILAGAIYSMTAKMTALKWSVIGKRLVAKQAAQIFSQAAYIGGYEWGGFISSTANDFYCADRGVFWETARNVSGEYTRMVGQLAELGHIDTLNCWITGNSEYPMVYSSDTTGQTLKFKPGEYVHFASLPSPREMYFGQGFCALSRAYKAATLLMGLHDYDTEKLSNLPPEGVAAVTGLTKEEFEDAIAMWMAKRKQDSSLTFPQVLWLIGSQPGAEVGVNFVGFSQIPESFDRRAVVDQYVAILALCFGVDAREFWPISSGALGSASESEIQHLKAKGKGPGEFISITERHLNSELPEDAKFAFDTQDIQEDMIAAQVSKAWIDAFWPLYQGIPNPNMAPPPMLGGGGLPSTPGNKPGQIAGNQGAARPPSKPTAQSIVGKQEEEEEANGKPNSEKQTEQVLTKEQFMRLLADKGVLPDYLVDDTRVMINDSDIHISKEGHWDDVTCYEWDAGVLKEKRLPPIVINSPRPREDGIPYAGVDEAKKESQTAVTVINNTTNQVVADFNTVEEALAYLEQKEVEILEKERKIRGSAIPEEEAPRGSNVTAKTLAMELDKWRHHPILSKYALTPEEEAALLASEPKRKVLLKKVEPKA